MTYDGLNTWYESEIGWIILSCSYAAANNYYDAQSLQLAHRRLQDVMGSLWLQ